MQRRPALASLTANARKNTRLLKIFRKNTPDDAELVKGCLADKRQSQHLLYERFAPEMKGVCLRYAQTSFEAEDLMHDGFVKVFRHLGSFKFECPLGAWIRKIMVNTALSYYRQKRHQTEFAELEILVNVAEPEPEMQHLAAEELMEMVRSLPDKYRLVFNLYGIEGYSHKEIAELLGITEVTSRSQFLRARHLLREMVNQEDKIRYEKIS